MIPRIARRLVIDENNCWLFQGAMTRGYGVIWNPMDKRVMLAHRVMYGALVEPLVPGMEIDHLCRVPACCNPAHLEQVPPIVNNHRSTVSESNRKRFAARTHCVHGHELTEENTRYGKRGKYVTRTCRTCEQARGARRYLALKSLSRAS